MTSAQGCERLCRKHSSVAPSIAPFVTLPDSSLPPESGDELSDQVAGPSGAKPPIANTFAATNIPMYSKDDLQRIFKTVLEARAPILTPAPVPTPIPVPAPATTPAPAPIIAEAPREKLKSRSPNVYHGKSLMNSYNFCQ